MNAFPQMLREHSASKGASVALVLSSSLISLIRPRLFCSGNCRFDAAVLPPVRLFLVVAVWAPSAFVLLGCYMYVYLVARAHARAIYTVELSFRHQTQTLALPRYGQTLALTVGAFLILWLPFQVSIAQGRLPRVAERFLICGSRNSERSNGERDLTVQRPSAERIDPIFHVANPIQ